MRLRLAALTLAVSLGIVGLASADGPTDWVKNWFAPTPLKVEPAKKLDIKTDATPSLAISSSNNRAAKAKADLERRQQVCLKLRDIAIAGGDEDLLRKADMLDQRAFDLYLAVKNQRGATSPAPASADAKKGGR